MSLVKVPAVGIGRGVQKGQEDITPNKKGSGAAEKGESGSGSNACRTRPGVGHE